MKFTMTTPCNDCPFRREGGIPLTSGRIKEIGGMMLNPSGGTFPCHKSVEYVDYKEEGDDGDPCRSSRDQVHCAGALIFAEANGNATQLMRIMERFGGYDHTKLADASLVWSSLKEWLRFGAMRRKGAKVEP